MRVRLILFVGICLALGTLTHADTNQSVQAQRPPTRFRVTAKGLSLEARGGVPVSGVVLYEPDVGRPTTIASHLAPFSLSRARVWIRAFSI